MRRRWFGGGCLALAIALLVAGETILQGRLGPAGFVAYWLLCIVCTSLAVGVALLDARAVRQEIAEQQRALIEDAVRVIERRNKSRPSRNTPGGSGAA